MPDGSITAVPESPLAIPRDKKKLVAMAQDTIEICRSTVGQRAAYCRSLNTVIETGRLDGTRALINKLKNHVSRLTSHLFSPTHLKFTVDFEYQYPQEYLDRGEFAARKVNRAWETNHADLNFSTGVEQALKFGAALHKQWVQQGPRDKKPLYKNTLVMPWQFGVYREDVNDLDAQPAMCETTLLTLPEVWRRIYYLPDAAGLFNRIKSHASRGKQPDEMNNFFHSVLSTAQINTSGVSPTRNSPGGIVQLNQDPNYAVVGPSIDADIVKMHELWMWDDMDWCTIQLIEPDVLIFPMFKRGNLLTGGGSTPIGLHPYRLIQPNRQWGYIWGRSEVTDLIETQVWMARTADDIQRLFGLQIDKIMAFSGFDGLSDETYDQFRLAGFFNGPPGAQVTDLTPQFPPQSLEMLTLQMKIIDNLGGFDNILGGQGQEGVRAGVQADTMMKAASPTLRDRALITERQCAGAADLTLSLMQIKDGGKYWTDGTDQDTIDATSFLLSDLPPDRRVTVDSHSTSPIFIDDHENTIAFGMKAGIIDGESAIEMMPNIPPGKKDVLIARYKQGQAAKAKEVEWAKANMPQDAAKQILKGK